MEELNNTIKNRRLLLLTAAISAVFIVAVLIITIAINKKKPVSPVAPPASKEKTMEDLKREFSTPVNPGIEPISISEEFIKSLSAPVGSNSGTELKTKTTIKPNKNQTSVSEDFIKNLSMPERN